MTRLFIVLSVLALGLPEPVARAVEPTQSLATVASPRPSAWAIPLTRNGLPNFFKVSDNLYRSAQPAAEGFKLLPGMGIKTVVNLRLLHSDSKLIANTGLGYESISFTAWHPENEDVVRFLKIVTDTNRMPVLVHCHYGADRTGTMCAIYRMVVQGWSREDAIREMTIGGYGFHAVWDNLIGYLSTLDIENLKKQVAAK